MFNRIKKLCDQKGISITRLERELGFGNGTIQKWKDASPTIDKLKLVAEVLEVSLDELAGRKEAS